MRFHGRRCLGAVTAAMRTHSLSTTRSSDTVHRMRRTRVGAAVAGRRRGREEGPRSRRVRMRVPPLL